MDVEYRINFLFANKFKKKFTCQLLFIFSEIDNLQCNTNAK